MTPSYRVPTQKKQALPQWKSLLFSYPDQMQV